MGTSHSTLKSYTMPIRLGVGVTFEAQVIFDMVEGLPMEIATFIYNQANSMKHYYSSEIVQLMKDVYDHTACVCNSERQFLRTVRHVSHFVHMRNSLHTQKMMEKLWGLEPMSRHWE